MKALKNREISFEALFGTDQNEIVDARRRFDDRDLELSRFSGVHAFCNGAHGGEARESVLRLAEDLEAVPLGKQGLGHRLQTFAVPFFRTIAHGVDRDHRRSQHGLPGCVRNVRVTLG